MIKKIMPFIHLITCTAILSLSAIFFGLQVLAMTIYETNEVQWTRSCSSSIVKNELVLSCGDEEVFPDTFKTWRGHYMLIAYAKDHEVKFKCVKKQGSVSKDVSIVCNKEKEDIEDGGI